MVNDLVRFAAKLAVARFGEEGDRIFNAAGFSAAFCQISGVKGPIDGRVVDAILVGRGDIEPLAGGAHYRLLEAQL